MELIRVLIIGSGSIGRRHFNLVKLRDNVEVENFSYRTLLDNSAALKDCLVKFNPCIIIVANKTVEHYVTLKTIEDNCSNKIVLIEKPLFDKIYELPKKLSNTYYVGYNLRYHPILVQLRQILSEQKIIGFYVMCGSYLPSWRSNLNYEESYSAKKEEGGGVLRDLSHEIDYCMWLGGGIAAITCVQGKFSNLNLTSDDTVDILAFSSKFNTPVTIHLDYLSRIPYRKGIIQTLTDTIQFDLISNTLEINGLVTNYNVSGNDTYILEHNDLLGSRESLCTLTEALFIQDFIQKAEMAAEKKVWVYL